MATTKNRKANGQFKRGHGKIRKNPHRKRRVVRRRRR